MNALTILRLRSALLPSAALAAAGLPSVLAGQAADEARVVLPAFTLAAPRVANEAPVGTFPMPVSGLRFEPQVDVQARNFAEGQADVAVRGGTFEGTGFRVGGGTLLDPQTGHYAAEIPVAPAMLGPVRVLTGAEAAFAGLNATAATLAYAWRPVQPRGEAAASISENRGLRASLYQGLALVDGPGGGRLSADLALARSESDGPLAGGDHDFARLAGRLQWTRGGAQTDLFAGWQRKFFGWPNLYTPYNWLETEDLETTLFVFNHRSGDAVSGSWQATALWRRNADDYEADRTRPGVFNPYRHVTRFGSAALEGSRVLGGGWTLQARAEAAGDSIESTALVFGPFRSRRYLKAGAVAAYVRESAGGGRLEARAGAAWADDNRGPGRFAPLAEIAWSRGAPGGGDGLRVFAQFSGDSQVASYTALKSNPAAGLFRGNAALGRSRTTNGEVGARVSNGGFEVQAGAFLRRDDGWVDWTYRSGVTARTASAVDIETQGFEVVATGRWKRGRVTLGYAWLGKAEDYRGAAVDASFYALNFPRHRATASAAWRVRPALEVRIDTEYREQEPNALRRSSPRAVLTSAGVHWFLPGAAGLEVSLLADNLWNSAFEEVPAVPAAPRQYSLGVAWHW